MIGLDDGFQDISTAPRDGTVVEVMDPDCGALPMRWDADGFNVLVSNSEGIWVCPAKTFTWSEKQRVWPTLLGAVQARKVSVMIYETITRSEATLLKQRIAAFVHLLEDMGLNRITIGSAMVGIGARLVHDNSESPDGVEQMIDAIRDACGEKKGGLQ